MDSLHRYFAFGLNVRSALEIPSWPAGGESCQVEIVWGDVPTDLPGASTLWGGMFQGRRDLALLNYPNAGRILIENGQRITLSPAASPHFLSSIVASTGFAALLYQRGALCLHASAVAWQGDVYLIMGPSGAGKSTTASALLAQGCEFVSDDITVVTQGAGGVFLATPTFPALRLHADAHAELGERLLASGGVDLVDNKIRLRYRGRVAAQLLPIRRICFLQSDDSIVRPKAEPIQGRQRVGAVQRSFFRRQMGKVVADPRRLAALSIELARRVEVIRLTRPRTGFALDELCQLVLGK